MSRAMNAAISSALPCMAAKACSLLAQAALAASAQVISAPPKALSLVWFFSMVTY